MLIYRTLLVVVFITFFTSLNAQISAGGALLFGTESELGLQLRAQYDYSEDISFLASFSFLDKADVGVLGMADIEETWRSLEFEGHYKIFDDYSTPYALAGFGLHFLNQEGSVQGISTGDSGTKLAFNLGLGYNYFQSDNIDFFGEIKRQFIADIDNQYVFVAGARYKF